MQPGTRVRHVHTDFAGTLMEHTRQGEAIVWWDTHFGVPTDTCPMHLLIPTTRKTYATESRTRGKRTFHAGEEN